MKYPVNLSNYGYCNKLMQRYRSKYNSSFSEEAMEKTIGYIIDQIDLIIEQNKGILYERAKQYLLSLKHITKGEYLKLVTAIQPANAVGILYWAGQQAEGVANLIPNHMAFTIDQEQQEQYLKFIRRVTLRAAKELAIANERKTEQIKTVGFITEDLTKAVKGREQLSRFKALTTSAKEKWLSNQAKHPDKENIKPTAIILKIV